MDRKSPSGQKFREQGRTWLKMAMEREAGPALKVPALQIKERRLDFILAAAESHWRILMGFGDMI